MKNHKFSLGQGNRKKKKSKSSPKTKQRKQSSFTLSHYSLLHYLLLTFEVLQSQFILTLSQYLWNTFALYFFHRSTENRFNYHVFRVLYCTICVCVCNSICFCYFFFNLTDFMCIEVVMSPFNFKTQDNLIHLKHSNYTRCCEHLYYASPSSSYLLTLYFERSSLFPSTFTFSVFYFICECI